MDKKTFDFLLNGNGDKFDKQSSEIKVSDRVFNWKESVKKPMLNDLKIEYKGQKYNSFSSKESKISFKKWKKTIFKVKKLKIKNFLNEDLKIIKNENIELKNNDLKVIDFPKNSLFDIFNNYKLYRKKFPNKDFNKFNIKKFLLWNKISHATNVIKKIGKKSDEELNSIFYESIYKYNLYKCYATTGKKVFDDYFQILSNNIKNKSDIKNKFKASKDFDNKILKKDFLKIKNEKKFLIKKLKSKSSKEKMNKSAFKNEKKAINRDIKFKKKLIKGNKPIRKMYSSKIENFFDIKRKKTSLFKILKTELLDIHKQIPIELSNKKLRILFIVGSIFPGLTELFQKRWLSGIIKSTITIILLSLIIPWIFGAFPSSTSNGIMGLKNFGATNGHLLNGNDSRFYLVMGSLAALMLFISISYFIIFGAININNMKKIKIGLRSPKFSKLISEKNLPYLFTAPALIFILFIVVLPLLASLFISFTNYNQRVTMPSGTFHFTNGATIPFQWVGLDQFKYIVKIVGKDFSKVLLWTLIWTFGSTLLTLFIGTFFAIIVNQKRIVGKALIRVIYILPWAIPGFVTILFFSIIFNESSIFNEIIGRHLFGRNIDWKNEVNYEKALLIFIQMWLGQSYIFILITGMIQSIPKDLYESSKIDGASNLNNFRKITMPIVVKAILPLLIGQFVGNFNNFNIIYLFNEGGPTILGNSVGETDIFISWIYDLINGGGALQRPAAGAALSFVVSIFVVTPSAFVYFKSKSFRERA